MKKHIILGAVITLLVIFTCGCNAAPKNFTVGDLTITLTKDFQESSAQGFDVYLKSDYVEFSAVEETSQNLEYAGYEITSLNDYCLELAELNNTPKSSIIERNGYYYFTNSKTISGAKYTYVHCMFEGADSYWVCKFVCKSKNYDRFKDDIFKWADSIEISK